MNRTLVFDMDGTIANLYGVENWLTALRNSDVTPYEVAEPMYDMALLNSVLNQFRLEGWKVVVTSWLAKNSTKAYNKAVAKAKTDWLEKYNFPYDELHIVKYGTRKDTCTKRLGGYQILIDDNADVRNDWKLGNTIDANNDIVEKLFEILAEN